MQSRDMSEAMLKAAETKLDSMVNYQDHLPGSTTRLFKLTVFESNGAIPIQIPTADL